MMKRQKYSSTIKAIPYMFYNSKKIANLMIAGRNGKELKKYCLEMNTVGVDSIDRNKEITSKIYDRLSRLDKYLLEQFVVSDIITSKFILLFSIMKQDRLFFEFMFEVYREAILNEKKYISIDDFDNFFKIKKEANEKVLSWGHYTIDQISKAYRNVLRESGFGKNDKRNILLIKQLVNPDVITHIIHNGEIDYIKAIFGGVISG